MEFRTQADIDKIEKIQNDYMIYLRGIGDFIRKRYYPRNSLSRRDPIYTAILKLIVTPIEDTSRLHIP